MKEYFYYEESVSVPKMYIVKLNHDNLRLQSTSGSFNVITARLLGFSYAEYLRFCRDKYGATLYGKNSRYVVAYFKDETKLKELIKILNKCAAAILEE